MFCCDMFCKLKNSDFRLKCSLLNEYVARNSKGNFFFYAETTFRHKTYKTKDDIDIKIQGTVTYLVEEVPKNLGKLHLYV